MSEKTAPDASKVTAATEDVPRWLQDMADDTIKRGTTNNHSFKIMDLAHLRERLPPAKKLHAESTTLEKKFTRQSSTQNTARTSLAAQVHARNNPQSINLTATDYLVPELEGPLNYRTIVSDLEQSDLQKSWRSLHVFQQTHKGRLDSGAKLKGWCENPNLPT